MQDILTSPDMQEGEREEEKNRKVFIRGYEYQHFCQDNSMNVLFNFIPLIN